MIEDLLKSLRYRSEGADLDFKREQYRFAGGNDFEKSEMLKDILAMANSWRDGTSYIVLGFKDSRPHPAEVTGITENIDDSRLQQFVNSKVKPKLTFSYEEHVFEGKTIGIFSIPKQKRPFYLSNAFGKLKNNVVYVRRGSSTDEADPAEVVAMGVEDAARGQVLLDLSVLMPNNSALTDSVALEYFDYPDDLPNFESKQKSVDPLHSLHSKMWRDNKDFWREYAEFVRVQSTLVKIKFVLKNRSELSLTNAKLELSIEPLSGQSFQMLAASDLPKEPAKQWNTMDSLHSIARFPKEPQRRLNIDEDGDYPICHVRFGSLLPGEEGRSSETLAILTSDPGKLLLRFRILAGELTSPYLSERVFETTGEPTMLDIKKLDDMYGKALLARYMAEQASR